MTEGRGVAPDFLCIGMQKGGTQWLYDQLRSHADFWMPPVKELHYFDHPAGGRDVLDRHRPLLQRWRIRYPDRRDREFLRAAKWIAPRAQNVQEYARLFTPKDRLLSGDVTPGYSTLDELTIERIVDGLPSVKVVLIIRDPVERFWSALFMRVRRGYAASADAGDWEKLLSILQRPGVRDRSYPSRIAARWQKFVPNEQFGLFFFDDLVRDPAGLRARILRFLGADPGKPSGSYEPGFNRKARTAKLPMSANTRARLAEYFAEELHASARAFGGPAAAWPAKYGI
jgi:hypothetical protein